MDVNRIEEQIKRWELRVKNLEYELSYNNSLSWRDRALMRERIKTIKICILELKKG